MDEETKKEIENLQNLNSFYSFWRNTPGFKSMATDGFQFNANVNYKYSDIDISDFAKVQITCGGYDSGKVSIYETKKFVSTTVHLDFDAKWQEFRYTDDNKLVIYGKSQKLGAYVVSIEVFWGVS